MLPIGFCFDFSFFLDCKYFITEQTATKAILYNEF